MLDGVTRAYILLPAIKAVTSPQAHSLRPHVSACMIAWAECSHTRHACRGSFTTIVELVSMATPLLARALNGSFATDNPTRPSQAFMLLANSHRPLCVVGLPHQRFHGGSNAGQGKG